MRRVRGRRIGFRLSREPMSGASTRMYTIGFQIAEGGRPRPPPESPAAAGAPRRWSRLLDRVGAAPTGPPPRASTT